MKTMQKGEDIIRVSEKEQDSYLDRGYKYIPKSIWKEKVRVIKNKKEEIKEKIKKKKSKK